MKTTEELEATFKEASEALIEADIELKKAKATEAGIAAEAAWKVCRSAVLEWEKSGVQNQTDKVKSAWADATTKEIKAANAWRQAFEAWKEISEKEKENEKTH